MQNEFESPSISKLTNVPNPGGTVDAVRLKARTVEELVVTENPDSAAPRS